MNLIDVKCEKCGKLFHLDISLVEDSGKEFICPGCQIEQVSYGEVKYWDYQILNYGGANSLSIEMTKKSKEGYEFVHSNSSYVIMAKQI